MFRSGNVARKIQGGPGGDTKLIIKGRRERRTGEWHVARMPPRPVHRLPSSMPIFVTHGLRNFGIGLLVNLAARATTSQPAAHQLRLGICALAKGQDVLADCTWPQVAYPTLRGRTGSHAKIARCTRYAPSFSRVGIDSTETASACSTRSSSGSLCGPSGDSCPEVRRGAAGEGRDKAGSMLASVLQSVAGRLAAEARMPDRYAGSRRRASSWEDHFGGQFGGQNAASAGQRGPASACGSQCQGWSSPIWLLQRRSVGPW